MGRAIGYIRVSSIDQNTSRQLDGIALDVEYVDKVSGKDRNRPELQNMLKAITTGDTVNVHSMDRLARDLQDLLAMVKEITAKGATVKFHKENLTFSGDKEDPFAVLLLGVIGSVAQFERSIIKERQREGIAIAKAAGVYAKHGAKKEMTPERIAELQQRIAAGEKKAKIARDMDISRDTLYRYQ